MLSRRKNLGAHWEGGAILKLFFIYHVSTQILNVATQSSKEKKSKDTTILVSELLLIRYENTIVCQDH